MATYTPNIGLHQWVPEDDFLRTDFNEDFAKIDSYAADVEAQFQKMEEKINQRCKLLTGTFTGTGSGTIKVNFGMTPKLVFLYGSFYSGICSGTYHTNYVEVTAEGITMEYNQDYNTNLNGRIYSYFVFCDC